MNSKGKRNIRYTDAKHKRMTKYFFLAACTSILAPWPAIAQDTTSDQAKLPKVTVTAEKRTADIQEVAISISTKTAEEITDAEIASITDLSKSIPNLHIFSWGGRRDNNIFIRGIGPGLFTEPTAGFYVDGVNYLGNGMFDIEFLDIERVEVLRGPQGTLYGGNSLGGVISITTKKPENDANGKLLIQGHDKGSRTLKSSINLPLVNNELYWNFSLSAVDADGFTESTLTGEKLNAREDYSARTKLLWTPNDNVEVNWVLEGEKFRGGSYTYAALDDLKQDRYKSTTVLDGIDARESIGTSLQIVWSGENMDFTSITGWRDWDSLNIVDQFLPAYGFYDSMTDDEQTQITQEFRLSSNNNQRLNWLAGFYAYKTDISSHSVSNADYTGIVMGGPYTDIFTYDKENSGYAFFGQLDYKFTDRWTLTTGIRADDESRWVDADVSRQTMGAEYSLSDKLSFHKWLPKITLSYTRDKALWYATVAKGYRAGGFDTLYLDIDKPSFDPEESTNYELGFKTSLWDRRAEFNAAIFRIDITDQQVQRILPSATAFNIVTDNAGESRSQGLEAELRFTPAAGWTVSAGAGYTDAEFVEYQFDQMTDYSGNTLPFAPEFSGNLAIENRRPLTESLNLFARLDINYLGKHYFDAANSLSQNAYHLADFKIGIEGETWDMYLWSKNFTDEFYARVITQQGPTPLAELGDPRFVGLTLNLRFQ